MIYVLSSSVYVYCESRGDLDCKVTTVMSTTEPCTLQRSNHIGRSIEGTSQGLQDLGIDYI